MAGDQQVHQPKRPALTVLHCPEAAIDQRAGLGPGQNLQASQPGFDQLPLPGIQRLLFQPVTDLSRHDHRDAATLLGKPAIQPWRTPIHQGTHSIRIQHPFIHPLRAQPSRPIALRWR